MNLLVLASDLAVKAVDAMERTPRHRHAYQQAERELEQEFHRMLVEAVGDRAQS